MRFRGVIICLLLLFSCDLIAQSRQGQLLVDSLLAELPKMQRDTNGVKLLNQIAYGYRVINPDSGISFATRELDLAQQLAWQPGEASAYNDLGNNYLNKSQYPQALDYFFKSLQIDETLKNMKLTGVALGNIGMVYWRQHAYAQALDYMTRSVSIAEQVGNKRGAQLSLGNMGAVYADTGNLAKALEFGLRSLKIAGELDDKSGIIIQSCNIGTEYKDLGQYSQALHYQFLSLRIAESVGDRQFTAINLGNIGEIYLAIAQDSVVIHADSLVPEGKTANLARAVEYLYKSVQASKAINFHQGISEFSDFLAKAYIRQGDYKAALGAYMQYSDAKDSMFSIAKSEKIASLETRRALELKDKDIQIAKLAIAKRQHERLAFIGGIVLLLIIMSIIFRNYRAQQKGNVLLSREKKRSDDLLLNILPSEVADELKEKGSAVAKQFDEVSVLFTDFIDFTGTSEKLSPQQLVKELDERFTVFDAIIERNGLERIKTIGDAYMAVCGLPVTDPDHARKTVRAAMEIRAFMEENQKQNHLFKIRIGINSGPVVAGIVGVKKFAYDIWGDTVNTATRMEQSSAANKINISQSTYERVKDTFACEYRGQIHVKNKGALNMYYVL